MIFVANVILLGICQETTKIPSELTSARRIIVVPDKMTFCPENQRKDHQGKCRKIF